MCLCVCVCIIVHAMHCMYYIPQDYAAMVTAMTSWKQTGEVLTLISQWLKTSLEAALPRPSDEVGDEVRGQEVNSLALTNRQRRTRGRVRVSQPLHYSLSLSLPPSLPPSLSLSHTHTHTHSISLPPLSPLSVQGKKAVMTEASTGTSLTTGPKPHLGLNILNYMLVSLKNGGMRE